MWKNFLNESAIKVNACFSAILFCSNNKDWVRFALSEERIENKIKKQEMDERMNEQTISQQTFTFEIHRK